MIASTMQDFALTTQMIVERMATLLPYKQVAVQHEQSIDRRSFAQVASRARCVAGWFKAQGFVQGDCIASLLWNCHEHLELFLAVPSMGCVLHTLNARLPADAISTMLAQTRPKAIVVDASLHDLLGALALALPPQTLVLLVNPPDAADGPPPSRSGVLDYAAVTKASHPIKDWPRLDERQPCAICYTSGTSGKSKGVVYSHRSALLHAMAMTGVDAIALSEHDVCLPIVPMFHALGWGFPYAACLSGADLAFSYRTSDPASLARLIQACQVTMATAVPTVWTAVLEAVRRGEIEPTALASLTRLPIGGAAVSRDLVEGFASIGIAVQHCWGMTELSPLGLVSTRRSGVTDEQWNALRLTPGVPLTGCELRIITEHGTQAPRDGRTQGELQSTGPWVTGTYLDAGDPQGQGSEASFVCDARGRVWLKTGDIATWDARGYVRIVDRAKDMIKSGGEWISSIELETAICSHPAVAEAAVVPVADPRWQERPLAYVSIVHDWAEQEPDLREYLSTRFPKWQIPDRFIFLRELPKGSTGKVDKRRLRELARG